MPMSTSRDAVFTHVTNSKLARMDGELSEEQRAALEERRQRSDKISRLMGPYLLKRYRMLSETCNVCKVSYDNVT